MGTDQAGLPVCMSLLSPERALSLVLTCVDWPYCNAARRMTSVQMNKTDWSSWDQLQWRRRLETFGKDDSPVIATGPQGEVDTVW